MASKSRIQKSVEKKLDSMLRGDNKPERGELQLLSVAVKYLAVLAKLDEGEWGGDLGTLDDPDDDTKGGNDDESSNKRVNGDFGG